MKTYENCGPTEILGHSPGVTFDAELSEAQEKTLIEGGGLRIVDKAPVVDPEPAGQEETPVEDPDKPVEPLVETPVETPSPLSGMKQKGK